MSTDDPHQHSAAQEHPHDHGDHHDQIGPVADASVRTARSSDAPAVGRVQAAVWRDAYSEVLSPEVVDQFEEKAFAKAWRDALESPPTPRHRLLVACAGAQVVGFAAIGPSEDPGATESSAELLALGVHPGARRVGHGSRLLNAAVDTMRAGGFGHCFAWLLALDEPTRAFLVTAGMVPDGAFRDRVVEPDDAVVREVRLGADLAAP